MKMNKTVSTKPYADGEATITELVIDFSNLTPEDIAEVAAQAAVVKWQSKVRAQKSIPTTDTYMVPKPGTRGAVDVVAATLRKAETMTPAEVEALIEEMRKRSNNRA